MWKMYSRNQHAGSSSDFWDESWEADGSIVEGPENDRICENHGSLWRLLDRVVRPDRLFLEGGCGCATWVRYFAARGHKALGIDFAERTVRRLNAKAPYADIRVGDITAFPLADGSVHSYYSGGVVEHFETGPEPALREAHRVLAKDGWFLCSIPDASTLRTRLIYPLQGQGTAAWGCAVRKVAGTQSDAPPAGFRFYQYLFGREEFRRRLEATGFEVVEDYGYSLIWGLTEIPGIGGLLRSATASRRSKGAAVDQLSVAAGGSPSLSGGPSRLKMWVRGLVERVALKEDTNTPLIGGPLKFALEHCSNMRMFVARPR